MKQRSFAALALSLAVLALAIVLAGPERAHAVNYTVDTTADNASLTACTAAANDCSLRGAIIKANSTPVAPDTITLPAGTYTIGGTRGDDTADTGDLDVTCLSVGCTSSAPLTINGSGAATTVIDAAFSDRVFDMATAAANTTTLNLNDLTIRQGDPGSSASGGAIRIGNPDTVNLTNVVVADSNASLNGGGISNAGNLTVSNTAISGNSALSNGGGIVNAQPGILVMNDSTINGNYANAGAGLDNSSVTTPSPTASLTNVTISGNAAVGNGGGVRNSGLGTATLSLTNVTVAGNTAPSGSGIFNDDSATVKNTLLANTAGTNCGGALAVTNSGGNLDSGATCGFALSNAAANLGALADNGGVTQTRALLAGSAAINSGTNTGCPGADQRGQPRADGNCDIGAYEAQGGATVSPTPAPTPTSTPAPTSTPPQSPRV